MSVAVLGEALVDLIAQEDGTYRPHLGGSPYNLAVALARQDVDVSYVSPLSDDIFGEQLRRSLSAEGVKLPVRRRSLLPTSLALVAVENGEPTYRLYRQGIADKDLAFDEVLQRLPSDLRVFHTGSLAITPSQLPVVRRLITSMRERRVVISIDINIRLRASADVSRYLSGVWSLLKLADVVKASDEDLAAFNLCGSAREAAEIAYREMGSGLLALTLGSGGACVLVDGARVELPAYPIPAPVDTIGAGDTFHAALLAFLLRDGTLSGSVGARSESVLREALQFASAAAAINISRTGCSPPTRQEVLEFIDKQGSRLFADTARVGRLP